MVKTLWPKSHVTEPERDAQLNQADIPRESNSCADESLAPRQESVSTAVQVETEVDATGLFLLISFVVATQGSCGCCREGHHVHNVPTWSPASLYYPSQQFWAFWRKGVKDLTLTI